MTEYFLDRAGDAWINDTKLERSGQVLEMLGVDGEVLRKDEIYDWQTAHEIDVQYNWDRTKILNIRYIYQFWFVGDSAPTVRTPDDYGEHAFRIYFPKKEVESL